MKARINHAPDFFRILKLRKEGKPFRDIAASTGIHITTVREILNNPAVHRQALRVLWGELAKSGKS